MSPRLEPNRTYDRAVVLRRSHRTLRDVKDLEILVLNRVRQYLVNLWSRCRSLDPHKVRASVWLTINRQI